MEGIKQIICINWGDKYGPPFINRLYAMIERNITPPFRLVCLCDNEQGIRDEIDCFPLPELDFEVPKVERGIWPKCRLWSEKLADLEGSVLFLDLDLVITSNLDEFFTYGEPDDVILARNPSNPLERLGQTSVYRFPVGKLLPLLEEFRKRPLEIATKYKFEQRYVTREAPGGVKIWPRKWVRHFRRECRRPFPLNYFLKPKLPESKIVIFPGGLHPGDAIEGIYKKGDPVRSPWEHVKAGIRGDRDKSFIKHMTHYILPTPWVAKHWKE